MALGCIPLSLKADIKLPSFFADGMVLQRDGTSPIWGVAAPHEVITANLNGQKASATADDEGHWTLAFHGLSAGGPFTLGIEGKSGKVDIANVLVGDVWFCWGDMNMAATLSAEGNTARDAIAAANDPLFHCFSPRVDFPPADPVANQPVYDIAGKWNAATPDAVSRFPAFGYYFGKELREQSGVPIGIINCTFGGAGVETWMPPDAVALAGFPDIGDRIAQYKALDRLAPKYLRKLAAWEASYKRRDPGNKGLAAGWAEPKTGVSDWKPLSTPGDWSPLGMTNGGVVWIRKTIDLPADAAGKDLTLHLGDIKNIGQEFGNILGDVYVNGKAAGKFGHVLKRTYMGSAGAEVTVPGRIVVQGSNVIAIRVVTQEQKTHPFGDGARLLAPFVTPDDPGWIAKVEAEFPPLPQDGMASRPAPPPAPSVIRLPGLFYNHLLRPFIGYGVKGIAAYHGESNVHVGEAYRRLFPALIQCWREQWKDNALPFYFTQIADCYPPRPEPGVSDWAELRESQLLTFKQVPHTGMAVTVDIGEADVHLRRKKDGAHRLVLAALAGSYGRAIEASGPIYDSMTIEKNRIRLKFTHLGGGLKGAGVPLKQFSVAGQDQRFVWADAEIDGDTVLVSSNRIPNPMAVRYAWAENPEGCNLFNKVGLPASPFRTDDWPLRTRGNTVKDLLLSLFENYFAAFKNPLI